MLLYSIIGFFLAITFHEFMHAWSANFLGDETAKRAGRLSLNPIAHIDIFGTILLPAVLIISGSPVVFGYAKPVPINPNNFKNPRLGSALTAIAGPISNFFLATLFSIILLFVPGISEPVASGIALIIMINLTLMVFNLIPVPPLDGSKFFALFFPALDNPKLELYGAIVLLVFLIFNGFRLLWPIILFIYLNVLRVNPAYLF